MIMAVVPQMSMPLTRNAGDMAPNARPPLAGGWNSGAISIARPASASSRSHPGTGVPPEDPPDERVTAVREALSNVIDPDLGVNIVDLGFVRAVTIDGPTAVITMTLTSAACPLTGVMENQIRTELTALGCIEGFRVNWQWIPAWRPADITDDGRDQLRSIGFTL